VPMEPDYPTSRIELLLEDTKARILLTSTQIFSKFLDATAKKDQWSTQLEDRIVYLDKPLPEANVKFSQPTDPRNPEGITNVVIVTCK
jgi:non-ribosomal peptide synthetase component F